jgi:hypothetical protein
LIFIAASLFGGRAISQAADISGGSRIHLGDVAGLGARVLGEVESPTGIENPFVEAVKEGPDTGFDRITYVGL